MSEHRSKWLRGCG